MELQPNGSGNQSEQRVLGFPYSPLATALILIAVLTMILVTLIGNILVVLVLYTSRALRAPQNLFLVSLAVADILVAILIIPFSLANEIMDYWCFGEIWCRLYLSLDVLFCTSSIMHLCAISLDRYWAVTRAVRYNLKRSPRTIKWMIGVLWIIASFVSLPPLFKDTQQGQVCLLNNDTWYVLASCTASFYAPCLIMVAVYCRIYNVAKGTKSTAVAARPVASTNHLTPATKGEAHRMSTQELPGEGKTTDPEPGQLPDSQPDSLRQSQKWKQEEASDSSSGKPPRSPQFSRFKHSSRQKNRNKDTSLSTSRAVQARERRLTFVLAFIIGAFVLCWFPFFFSYSLESVLGEDCCISKPLFKFFFWMGYCNSSLNPIIYTIFNRDFRRGFQRLLSQADPFKCRK